MNRFNIDETVWQAAKAEAKAILIERARGTRLITYSDLAREVHSFHFEPHDFRLFDLIGDISTEESVAGRGMLSALVVIKDENTPGSGFFELARKLGLDVKDQDVFWGKEVKRIYATWKK